MISARTPRVFAVSSPVRCETAERHLAKHKGTTAQTVAALCSAWGFSRGSIHLIHFYKKEFILSTFLNHLLYGLGAEAWLAIFGCSELPVQGSSVEGSVWWHRVGGEMFITTCQVEAISVALFQFTESKGDLLSPSAPTAIPCSILIPSLSPEGKLGTLLPSAWNGFHYAQDSSLEHPSSQSFPLAWVEDPLSRSSSLGPTLGHAHFHGRESSLFVDKPS